MAGRSERMKETLEKAVERQRTKQALGVPLISPSSLWGEKQGKRNRCDEKERQRNECVVYKSYTSNKEKRKKDDDLTSETKLDQPVWRTCTYTWRTNVCASRTSKKLAISSPDLLMNRAREMNRQYTSTNSLCLYTPACFLPLDNSLFPAFVQRWYQGMYAWRDSLASCRDRESSALFALSFLLDRPLIEQLDWVGFLIKRKRRYRLTEMNFTFAFLLPWRQHLSLSSLACEDGVFVFW